MDSGTVDVLKRGQMQRYVLEQGQMQSQGFKHGQMQSNVLKRRQNQLPYRERNVSTKHALSKITGGTTELKTLLTPINLFEDECIFCHSFRTSDEFHGPMVCYLKGRLMSIEEGNLSNAIYVHKKCLQWAPKVCWDFNANIVENLESEIRRASRLRCARCGLRGAALGCYYKDCRNSFHVPCAVQIIGCRWDVNERCVLCPKHVSETLPCDELSIHTKENDNSSSLHKSQCSQEEHSFTDFEEENQQADQLKTARSFLPVGQCTDKEGKFDDHHRERQQTDQLNTSNASSLPQSTYMDKEVNFDNQQTDQFNTLGPSCLPQSQCSQKEGISTDSSRDGQQIDQLDTSGSSSLQLGQHSGDEGISNNHETDDQRTHKHNTSNLPSSPKSYHPDEEGICNVYKGEVISPSDQLVLLGLSLSTLEKDSLQEFASWTNAKLTKEWNKDVTHVIVGKRAGSSWNRSFEVLMAVLLGKWVVHFEWITDCSWEMRPRPEASYEVASGMDSLKTIEGPKKGRIRAAKGAPNLFSGLRFRLSAYMNPDGRHRMRDLIAAAGGQVLEVGFRDSPLECSDGGASPVKPYFVFDGDAPGEFAPGTLLKEEVEEARKHAAAGAQVISHLRVLDAVAAYDAGILDR